MNCLWKDISDRDANGFRRVKCIRSRCDGEAYSPYPYLWDDGRPRITCECKGTPAWSEFGNWLEILLQVIGITKARWSWLAGKPKGGCNTCNQRQEVANSLGARLASWLKNLRSKITSSRYTQDTKE